MTKKTLDAVKLMRELRNRLSQEMQGMTPEERMRHVRDRAATTQLGRKLREHSEGAAQQGDAADRPSAGR